MKTRRTPTLKIVPVTYQADALDAWKHGRYEAVLGKRRDWGVLEEILAQKAGRRRQGLLRRGDSSGDARFFGEAVATKYAGESGWFGSFKWLTSSRWASQARWPEGVKSDFRTTLQEHFGRDLTTARAMAMKLAPLLPRSASGRPGKPVAPDLWLLARNGSHRFIEVKLSDRGDTIRESQLAGLAVIATCLGSAHVVSVELFSLCCARDKTRSDTQREIHAFEKFCGILKGHQSQGG